MSNQLIVRGAPQEYSCHEGSWSTLPDHLNARKLTKLLVLHGNDSWEAAKPYLPDLSEFDSTYEYYGGVCTDQRTSEVVALFQKSKTEAIVAVGGGKITDLAKQAAHQLRCPVIILPTLASTCAAYTPLSVMYFEDGAMDRFDIFPQANALVLIEPRVILASPRKLLIAGIADTLAKWYEGDAIIRQLDTVPVDVQVAHFAAKQCQENLLTYSYDALAAMDQQELNAAFLTVVETNILLAGMVGGFGDEYGRTAGAHSIHDAITMIPESHHQLHGNKVAYGIFVQLVIEKNLPEIEKLLPFYQELELPTCLADMNMHFTEEDYRRVAERATIPEESIHLLAEEISPEIVIAAMKELETFITDKK